ncbi:MAG: DUF5722 domain-containing protein [Lachnospiraceae bacterium]
MKREFLKKVFSVSMSVILTGLTVFSGALPVSAKDNTGKQENVKVTGSALLENNADESYVYDGEKYTYEDLGMPEESFDDVRAISGAFESKKGLQGANASDVYKDLGVKHTLFNCNLTDLIASPNDYYDKIEYNGKTYYFDAINGLYPTTAYQMLEAGMDITVVLLMPWTSNHNDLIYSGARSSGHTYYAWNLDDQSAIDYLTAMMMFLGKTYGNEGICFVKNWIIGNEVNMPNAWNYTGTTNLDTNVTLCARQFQFANNILKSYNSNMKCYISLDHSWSHNDDGRGIAGKTFLTSFAQKINALQPGIDWNIAYHAYPAIMTNSDIWSSNSYTTDSENTDFISGKNLNVLTGFVKNNFGSDVRIILSEQGFTVNGGQEARQAAALAYTYYKAEFDDMIDSVIFRSLYDDPNEAAQGFSFGILNSNGSKRPAYDVFKFMDTEQCEDYTKTCLSTMGKGSWSEVVSGYDPTKFIIEDPISAFVTRIYVNTLQRRPDAAGKQTWVNELIAGTRDGFSIGYGFVFSDEFKARNVSNRDFVEIMYNTFLNRSSDEGGMELWASALDAGMDREVVFHGFVLSTEFAGLCSDAGIKPGTVDSVSGFSEIFNRYRNRNVNVTKFVSRCYLKALGRAFDVVGLDTWCMILHEKQMTPKQIAVEGFLHSDEFINKGLSNTDFVKVLYETFLGRTYDEDGLNMWVGILDRGERTRDEVINGFADSDEFAGILAGFGLD